MTPGILDTIDGALLDWRTSGDAMRRTAEPAAAVRPVRVTAHFRVDGWQDLCVRVTVYSEKEPEEVARRMARFRQRGWSARPASHCGECNPAGNPGPLAVDGHDYQRRLKARRKRRRR